MRLGLRNPFQGACSTAETGGAGIEIRDFIEQMLEVGAVGGAGRERYSETLGKGYRNGHPDRQLSHVRAG